MKIIPAKLFTPPPDQRLFGLDFLRALAILAVLLTHSTLVYPFEQKSWFHIAATTGGHLGVELFFVLSGFLIGSILLSLEPKFQKINILPFFWQRRWFRTIPNYLFFLFLYIIATLAISKPLPNILSYITFTQNWLWPHPLFFDQAWSLAIEEWFYLLFPISLFIFYRLIKSFNAAFLISTGIFIVLPSAIRINWAMGGLEGWNENFRTVMFVRLDAIMYGVLAAWVKRNFPAIWKDRRFLFLITGAVILYTNWTITFSQNLNISFFAKTFYFSFTSLGIACILPVCDQWNNVVETPLTKAVRLIALWSYSLYLCNFLVVQALSNIMDIVGRSSYLVNTAFFAAFFAINLLISSVLYTFLEKPVMNIRERFSKI
jgi:peptidoglycan/LPS O-acetylase OafA/YrhL